MNDRRRPRRLATACVALVAVAACGGGNTERVDAERAGGAPDHGGPVDVDAGSPGTATDAPDDTTSAQPGDEATAAPVSAPSTSTATSAPTVTDLSPTPPGRYVYDQSGTVTEGSSERTVDERGFYDVEKVDGSGRQDRVRVVDDEDPAERTRFRFHDGGSLLERFAIEVGLGGALRIACVFDPGVPVPPWPASEGAQASASTDCGSFTADATVTVVEQADTDVAGTARRTWVVVLEVTFEGQVTGTVQETQHFDPVSALAVRTHRVMSITYGFSRYRADITSQLRSLDPA